MSQDPMSTHGAFSWVEHHGPDAQAARAFYESVLGWTIQDTPMESGDYPAIVVGERPVGGVFPGTAESPGWLAYVTVDDVDARAEAAEKAGATLISPPNDAPGVGRMATLRDPFGARLALITYAPKDA